MPEILEFVDAHSWVLLPSMLALLGLSAFLGKLTWGRRFGHEPAADDELKIVLGATLSLFGLLIGFLLSFAIGGYNTRMAAEENEAIAIGNAFQRTTLLGAERQAQAERLLLDYLDRRVGFFAAADEAQREQARMQSIQMQARMWTYVARIASDNPDPVIATVLNACNDLYTAQQKTMASWRHQIPGAAWAMLVAFGVCSNFLIGYNIRGRNSGSALLLVVPAITALAMFLIAEIDVPGKGLIHVTPDNLQAIRTTLSAGGLAP
ncbi:MULTISPECIES: hypothetical protein [Stenotrophomonas]|uniref:Membrane protein n=1 Tax=Stenotrophomonas nitritireducens TaxID=83617 RepID=A0ABR5NPR6_9GAMM|nr:MULTISPECIES: hypothetical protein [Stenotrophomonas]KQN99339.1 hypothetical protein ASF01_07295 [Stenotrophomonas sp. Leaf70]KRG60953.1 membrane protein [Stenotrophomonas nitritireducens]